MGTLPPYHQLRIAQLAAVFNHTTNSYKFYWFWGLLELVQEAGEDPIPLDAVLIKMVALSWHTVAYYRLSLGVQDRLGELVHRALASEVLQADAKVAEVEAYFWACCQAKQPTAVQKALVKALRNLRTYVPYRFLRPFFGQLPKGNPEHAIAERAQAAFKVAEEAAPYKISASGSTHGWGRLLIIHPLWHAYLRQHYKVLQEFGWWNLCQYLRNRNPNVPNISAKLQPPYTVQRHLKTAKAVWKTAIEQPQLPPLYDPYQGVPLSTKMPIDHFIPWSFVLHDRLWNLAPTTIRLNSSKGNRLPHRHYWSSFTALQYEAFQRCCIHAPRPAALLEDYCLLFRTSLDTIVNYTVDQFTEGLQRQLEPLWQQAVNLGFQADWTPPA